MSIQDPPSPNGPAEFGSYVLLRELGRGAIGVVYAAYHEGLDRKLAIKVLNRARAGRPELEARLRREARALARLSHPNVVQVYDVGEIDKRVFIVMEFVEGVTLGEWLRGGHSLDEVLALMIAAGRGLAAAHAAGVVHRDFKPDNVIVGQDGRPRVLDFGLARAMADDERSPEPAAPAALELREAQGRVGNEVSTRTGVRMGTPAYMSPEQFMAKPLDHRSDQFSFCTVLHEAVYGRRPYPARNQGDLLVQVHSGKISPAPINSPVPSWLREVIVRGLSPKPEDRWSSMDELLAALDRRPSTTRSSRRRWKAGLALLGVGLVALAIGWLSPSPSRRGGCPSPADAAAQVWTPEQARALAEVFASSGSTYADAAWGTVEGRIDAWVEGWASEGVAVCEAAQEGREGTQQLDRRSACLDRGRRAFEGLVEQLGAADHAMVEHAVEAVAALPDPARCGSLDAHEATLAAVPVEHTVEVASLREELAKLDLRLATRSWESALPLARSAVERAEATGYGPVIAEAQLIHGRVLAQSTRPTDEALARLQEALDQAERSGHHELIPSIAIELVSLSIYAKPDPIRGRLWARRALSGLDRLERERGDAHVLVRARGMWALGNLERLDGDYEQAVRHIRVALNLLDAHAPTHPDRGIMLNDLGNALAARGDEAGAQAAYERALVESLAAFGEGHPRVGNAHFNLARLAMGRGDWARAREQADRAFIIFAGAYGLDHRDVGSVELLRAGIELGDEHIDAARQRAARAQAIYDAVLAPDNLDRAEPHQMLGHVAFMAGEFEQARSSYRAALAIKRAALPDGHIELVSTLTNLGLVQIDLGEQAEAAGKREVAVAEYEAATADLEQALALLEASEGVDPEQLREGRAYLVAVRSRVDALR